MSNVKMIFDTAGTIVGEVIENVSDSNFAVKNPVYVVPTEEGFSLIPALVAMGVDDSEDEMLFTKSEIKYGKCYTPNEMIVKNYQDMFKDVKLELPDTQLIL